MAVNRSIPIIGKKVTAVGGQYAIGITMDGHTSLLIEDPIEGTLNDGESIFIDPRYGRPDLEKITNLLAGRTVEYAEYTPDYTLNISFDQGVKMRVVPNREGYDSWSVTYPPDHIIIGNYEFA